MYTNRNPLLIVTLVAPTAVVLAAVLGALPPVEVTAAATGRTELSR